MDLGYSKRMEIGEFVDLFRRRWLRTSVKVLAHSVTGRKHPFRVRIYGVPLFVRARSPDIQVALSSLGDEFSPLSTILPSDFSGLIIDAGGYIGTAAIKFSKMYPHAKVITIEPSEENFAILQENIKPFKNISAVKAALVAANRVGGTKLLDRGQGQWGFTIVKNPLDGPDAAEINIVETITLAEIAKSHHETNIGILKLDIEGAEKEIFDHAGEQLKNVFSIFVELHDRVVLGCSESFKRFSEDRLVLNFGGEKFLSVSRH
jgi:FkbM family methyltransferase